MATSLHEQTGLRIWRNDKNGFTVCRLHFTADPRKRSSEWLEASKRGLSVAKWRQEFDIDYSAHMGEKAFPEILSKRQDIVQKEGPYADGLWPTNIPMWGGFDYGARNPSSFHVYTVIDGVTWAIWELYGPCKNLPQFVNEMLACPYWPQIKYILHDPDMGNLKNRNSSTGDMETIRSQFERAGITKWVAGRNDENSWLTTMAKHWCGSEVTFKILETCPRMIEEFEEATYVTMSDRQLETQNYREALVDRKNHALDDCKYFMNSGLTNFKPRILKLPSLVAGYGWGGDGQHTSVRERELLIGAR